MDPLPSTPKTREASPTHPGPLMLATPGPTDEPLPAMSTRLVDHDICASPRTSVKETADTDVAHGASTRGAPARLSCRRALVSAPTLLDLSTLSDSESVFSCGTNQDRPHDATKTASKTNGDDDVPPRLPYRKPPIASISSPSRTKPDNCLKRQRSSVDSPPQSKKLKLERTVSHISCAADSSVEHKFQATQPASFRRAQSLRSECSIESVDIPFSCPLSPPDSRSGADDDYPPTVPSTPLPDSVDYARSKANPMVRTIRYYRRRSLEVPPIPPVPIIAPPKHLPPVVVRSREDYAIERIQALLQRERGERQRDGLDGCDDKRAERLRGTRAYGPAFPIRGSGSVSDSSDKGKKNACTESSDFMPSPKTLYEQHRTATKDIWSDAFGITNDVREEVTRWMLEKLPEEPVPHEEHRDKRPVGADLYDQLTNSRQTRFHAVQLFHRYFILPDKVEMWKDTTFEEVCSEEEFYETQDNIHGKRGVWVLAVGCIALAIKLHRDCWWPLGPISSPEYMALVPFTMTRNALELAQRDLMSTFQFMLGTCTPQDILDEMWEASPALRRTTASIRDDWAFIQDLAWKLLFECAGEPDMLQYPVSLLTAAALVDGLVFALWRHHWRQKDGFEQFLLERDELVKDVVLDVRDVLEVSENELTECRTWLRYAGNNDMLFIRTFILN